MSLITTSLNWFTAEQLEATSKVVYENGWQNSGGVMQFSDALGVLENVLMELRAADKEGLIDAMPVSLQQTINSGLANIQGHATQIRGGSQHVPAFSDEVDRLHLAVWQGGFRYRGKKVLGYEEKYKQIAALAKEINRIKEREADAKRLLESIEEVEEQATESLENLQQSKSKADSEVQAIAETFAKAQTTDTEIDAHIASIDEKVEEATESASTAEAKAQSATANEKRLQDFIARVDANETKLTEALQSTSEELQEIKKALRELMSKSEGDIADFKTSKTTELNEFQGRLEEIEKDITDKLANATGITLFHAFENRQTNIKGHWIWLAIAGVVFATVLIMTAIFVNGVTTPDAAFYIKLSLGLPAVVFGAFALQQYGKERRLKEEYAFKSSISLSLEAYRKLVREAVDELSPEDRVKFADFLVASIATIFDSPTERVFGVRKIGGPTDTKIISTFIKNLKDAKGLIDGK